MFRIVGNGPKVSSVETFWVIFPKLVLKCSIRWTILGKTAYKYQNFGTGGGGYEDFASKHWDNC